MTVNNVIDFNDAQKRVRKEQKRRDLNNVKYVAGTAVCVAAFAGIVLAAVKVGKNIPVTEES